MNSDNNDLLFEKRRQCVHLMTMLALHCRNHRMLDISLDGISLNALEIIGNEILDLFVDRAVKAAGKGATNEDGAKQASG